MQCLRTILALALLYRCTSGAPLQDRFDESDLATFVTRPDIRPPVFDITVHDKDATTPGYWFVSPYVDLKTRIPSSAFSPGQIGPHIYDNEGNLVYSGAHLVGDRTSFDFKAITINGTQHLSMLLDHDETRPNYAAGAGIIVDSKFKLVSSMQNRIGNRLMNMHEFNVVEDGKSALTITYEPQLIDYSNGKGDGPYGWIGNNGFQEVNLETGELIFQWWALDHVDPSESTFGEPGKVSNTWDFFHMNSVDKNSDGDYLVSARYTNTIYKISGRDGSIIWRLGGKKSSFKLNDFHFSSQHDARFRRQNKTTTVISFLNNAANGHQKTSDTSSVIVAALDTATMEATVVQNFERPDGQLTKLRGNAQELSNGNYFICWSENGHISEHTPDGRLTMEAQFSSKRFVTYRAAKFNFTGRPEWPPAAKGVAYGVSPSTSTTAVYASWNGATEVSTWRFWGSGEKGSPEDYDLLGEMHKDGFESMFMAKGFIPYILAEAVSADGESLGISPVEEVSTPKDWTFGKSTESSREFYDQQRAEFGSSLDNSHVGLRNAGRLLSKLDERLMDRKSTTRAALYLWVFSVSFFGIVLCVRRYKRIVAARANRQQDEKTEYAVV